MLKISISLKTLLYIAFGSIYVKKDLYISSFIDLMFVSEAVNIFLSMADYFYPYHYPTLKHETLSPNMVRINLVDQTGKVLAWWDEEAGQESQQFDPFSIYACNLDLRTSKDEIFSHFCSLGKILRITYLKNKKNNSFNGSIYVQFKTIQAAEEALYLDGSYLRGKLIYVKAGVFNIKISMGLNCSAKY